MQNSVGYECENGSAMRMLKRPRIGVTDVERINKVSSGGRVSMGFYGFLGSLAGRPLAADMHPMYRLPIRLEERMRSVDLSCFSSWDDLLTEDVAEKKLTPRDGRCRHVIASRESLPCCLGQQTHSQLDD